MLEYISANWLWILVAFLAIIGVLSLVRTFLKWFLVIAIVVVALIYGTSFAPQPVKDIGQKVLDVTAREAINLFMSNTSGATYSQKDNGEFTIKIKDSVLVGRVGSGNATLTMVGKEFDIEMSSAVIAFVNRMKEQHEQKSKGRNK